MSQSLRRLARKAKEEPRTQFTAIAHLLTEEVYWAAWHRLKKSASAGVDGVTATAYAADLGVNLRALHARVKANQYRPQPVRRVHIPKEGGQTRPLGVPALEDKLVQGAVRLVLEAIYEQDFLPCSYGFRSGRSPHQALAAWEQALSRQKVNYGLDVDSARCLDAASYCPPIHDVDANRLGCVSITLIRKPLRRPDRTCTASSSPRFTRCNTVCRETPSRRVASRISREAGGAFSTKRARISSVTRIPHGAPGVSCAPAMKPSLSQR